MFLDLFFFVLDSQKNADSKTPIRFIFSIVKTTTHFNNLSNGDACNFIGVKSQARYHLSVALPKQQDEEELYPQQLIFNHSFNVSSMISHVPQLFLP